MISGSSLKSKTIKLTVLMYNSASTNVMVDPLFSLATAVQFVYHSINLNKFESFEFSQLVPSLIIRFKSIFYMIQLLNNTAAVRCGWLILQISLQNHK